MAQNSRRDFLKKSTLGATALGVSTLGASTLGASTLGLTGLSAQAEVPPQPEVPHPARQVWVATLTQHNMEGTSCQEVIQAALRQMENALPFRPDIICLPEVFHVAGVKGGRPSITQTAEDGSGKIIGPFQAFAKQHRCYVIATVYALENGRYYNSAFVIDRQGQVIGKYHKIRPTTGEMDNGISPGPLDPPVFKTDFGTIGVQTCFDIEWPDGWQRLRQKGAELVFWPSAFAGGKMVNTMAWLNKYPVVSSTRKGTTKICDVTGEELAVSGSYSRWGVCAPINLEKVFLHSYPYNRQFPAIQQKYGQKVRIYTLHEEEFSIIESMSPQVKVADIMREFDLKTHEEHMQLAETQQKKFWS